MDKINSEMRKKEQENMSSIIKCTALQSVRQNYNTNQILNIINKQIQDDLSESLSNDQQQIIDHPHELIEESEISNVQQQQIIQNIVEGQIGQQNEIIRHSQLNRISIKHIKRSFSFKQQNENKIKNNRELIEQQYKDKINLQKNLLKEQRDKFGQIFEKNIKILMYEWQKSTRHNKILNSQIQKVINEEIENEQNSPIRNYEQQRRIRLEGKASQRQRKNQFLQNNQINQQVQDLRNQREERLIQIELLKNSRKPISLYLLQLRLESIGLKKTKIQLENILKSFKLFKRHHQRV